MKLEVEEFTEMQRFKIPPKLSITPGKAYMS